MVFFFRFIRLAAWVLFLLLLLQMPVMFSNYQGRGLQNYPTLELSMLSRIMKLSLANQPDLNATVLETGYERYAEAVHNRRLHALMDALCILVGMGFVVFWECRCHTLMARAGNAVPPSNYTIFVKRLPEGCTELSLT